MNSNLEAAIQEALADMEPIEAKELSDMLANVGPSNKNKKKKTR